MEATRAALLDAARAAFAERGYADVGLGEIARTARVTTGAIYHHFGGKKALFQAVAESLEEDLLAQASGVGGEDPWELLTAGFLHMIDLCADPVVQRVLFVEAPQVLGPEEWREIELRYAYGGMRRTLDAMGSSGMIRRYPVDFLARTLLAILREAAAEIAADGGPETRAQVEELVRSFLDTLRTG